MLRKINMREAYIIGLYLAKFDRHAVIELGCKTWDEVYDKIGSILDYKPASIKNNRDLFDPYFPNKRKGWNYRPLSEKSVEILEEFKNYGFEKLTIIVENILSGNLYITDLIQLNIDLIKQETVQKEKERTLEEEMCVLALQEKEGGETEVAIFDKQSQVLVGLADLITDTEVIEVKHIKNWKHAIGQIFAYWYNLENNDELSPRIHLFGYDGIDDNKIKLCKSLMDNIFSPHFDGDVIVTYS
jgi:hypothetical protein